jgi:hypothetical protein
VRLGAKASPKALMFDIRYKTHCCVGDHCAPVCEASPKALVFDIRYKTHCDVGDIVRLGAKPNP